MATRTVGNLKIQLDVNNKRFQAKMTESTKTVKKFETVTSGAKRVLGSIGRVTKGLAVGVAGATVGMGYLVNKSFDTLDALAKTSDKLGITTEGLQALRMAAKLTGVETGTLDMALQRMVRRVSEAAQGTGEAVGALQELGLNAEQLNKLAPDQQFMAIAEAMKQVQNPADRIRLAMRLFDSEGVELVRTLGLGAEGIQAIGDRMAGFGGLFGRDMLRGVEAMRDALTWTWEILGSIINRIAIGLAPWIEGIAARFNMWLEHGGVNWILSAIEQTAWWLHNAYLVVKQELTPAFDSLKETAQEFFNGGGAGNMQKSLEDTLETIKKVDTVLFGVLRTFDFLKLGLLEVALLAVKAMNFLEPRDNLESLRRYREGLELAEGIRSSIAKTKIKMATEDFEETTSDGFTPYGPPIMATPFITPQTQAQAPVMRMTGPDGEMIVYDPNTERTANALENVLQNGLPLAVN